MQRSSVPEGLHQAETYSQIVMNDPVWLIYVLCPLGVVIVNG